MHIDRLSRFGIIGVLAAALVSGCATERSMEDEAALASCASCHGGEDNDTGAPPGAVFGVDSPGIGAHTAHVDAGVACESCHDIPARVGEDHPIGRTRAVVTFGGLAFANGATPQYDPATYTCSSVYCHGTTLDAGGHSTTPSWGQDLAHCGSCHSYPPPSHIDYDGFGLACSSCHPLAVESDDFTFKPAHLNGKLDFKFN
jgi:predicted CxxxxCH...CXXCH cytochrome family protein